MYKFRPSYLKSIIANPANYWKLTQDISNLEAVKQGITREKTSYELYEKLTSNKDYKAQVLEAVEHKEWTLVGTADIITNDSIIDIKNSVQNDTQLIKEYQYQLSAYCYLFNKEKAYLFVDSNKGDEKDLSKVRLIQVPIIPAQELIDTLNAVAQSIQELENLNFNLIVINKNSEYDSMLDKYFKNKAQIKQLEQENKEIAEKLNKPYENDNYIVQYEATRHTQRIVNTIPTNTYDYSLKIKEK